ncbi:MAG: hypothetical protein AB1791_09290 [Chloroflexota bacterium]
MTSKNSAVTWNFVILWVAAAIIGMSLGQVFPQFLATLVAKVVGLPGSHAVAGAIKVDPGGPLSIVNHPLRHLGVGFFVSSVAWLVVRQLAPWVRWYVWIPVIAFLYFVGGFVPHNTLTWQDGVEVAVVTGLMVGLAEARMLHMEMTPAAVWTISGIVGLAIGLAIGFPLEDVSETLSLLYGTVLAGGLSGAFTGLVLMRYWKPSAAASAA